MYVRLIYFKINYFAGLNFTNETLTTLSINEKKKISVCCSDHYLKIFLTFLKIAKPHCFLVSCQVHAVCSPDYPKYHLRVPELVGESLGWGS